MALKARSYWQILNKKTRSDYVYQITRTSLELSDGIMNIVGLMTEFDDGFFVER